MIMRSEKVPESPSSALQTTYFGVAGASAAVFHLMPVGNPAPPRPRRPDFVTSATTLSAPSSIARFEASISAVRNEVVERHRIGHAHARERQPGLRLEPRYFFGDAETQPMLAAVEKVRIEQRRDVSPPRPVRTRSARDWSRPRPSARARTSRAIRCARSSRPACATAASIRIASATASAPSDTALESRGT